MARPRMYGPKPGCRVAGCVKEAYTDLCRMHYNRVRRTGSVGTPHQMWGMGISPGWVTRYGYREVFRDGRVQKEHRYVMAQSLGRELLPTEDVHHINGDKLDNRESNLELWSTDQPRGQRVADKVEYALRVLSLYAPEALSGRM